MNKNELMKTPSRETLNRKLKVAINNIDKKLDSLGIAKDFKYLAGSNFKYNENDSTSVNIQNSIDIVYLIKGLSLMNRVNEDYKITAENLGYKEYPVCLWFGYKVIDWIHDFEARINTVKNQNLINQLNSSKQKLQQFLSEDEKLYNTLVELDTLIKI